MLKHIAVFALVALCAMAVAYQPESNITRGIYCHTGGAMSTTVWSPFGARGQYDTDEKHGGQCSLKCDNTGGERGSGSGANQAVLLNQTEARPIKIAGWSKAEGVREGSAYEYSLYVDLRYDDGEAWFMQIAAFKPGTHDWEYSESIIQPAKPVKSASFHAFIREKPGIVWFDDLFFGEVDGENLLKNPGFEPETRVDDKARAQLIADYKDLNANAMHTYFSPNNPIWGSDLLDNHYDGEAPLDGFLAAMKAEGIGVWITLGSLSQSFKSMDDPNFPAYYCPNEKWGENWVNVLGDISKCDIAGLSLVPDEYNYHNGTLKRGFEKYHDEAVRKFYEDLPIYCNGPGCQTLFEQVFGEKLPDLHMAEPTDAWRKYINFRYMTTNEWIRKGAEAIKSVNPGIHADSLICVTPVCSDRWWSVGVAWDEVGYNTKIDFLTTDPYILLHNYLGDSTHWYVTETCERLSGGHPKRQCGSVLEASRLRAEFRELAPVEVYGSALTSVFHGAKELAWWHHTHITGESGVCEDADKTYALVKGTYRLLEDVDPWLEDLTPVKRVALLHSRASEDWWQFYAMDDAADCLTHPDKEPRYASRAQVEPLMMCLRNNIPVDLYYLESVTAQQLADYPVILVPFAFAIDDEQVQMLQSLAEAGAAVVIISEVGTLTEDGKLRDRAALLDLVGLKSAPRGERRGPLATGVVVPQEVLDTEFTVYRTVEVAEDADVDATVGDTACIFFREVGEGGVLFMAGEFGVGLPESYDNEKRGREERVYPPVHKPGMVSLFTHILAESRPGEAVSVASADVTYNGDAPEFPDDVETVMATNAQGDLIVFCANWTDGTAAVEFNVDGELYDTASASGRAILPDATVIDITGLPGELAPQQACVIRVPAR